MLGYIEQSSATMDSLLFNGLVINPPAVGNTSSVNNLISDFVTTDIGEYGDYTEISPEANLYALLDNITVAQGTGFDMYSDLPTLINSKNLL